MKRNIKYLFVLCSVLYACNHHEQVADDAVTERSIVVETQGTLVSPDSISEPIINMASSPEPIQISEGATIQYESNIHPLKQPTVVPVNVINITTPLVGAPVITIAKSKTVSCVLNEPVPAEPFRFRDNANCNIQYLDVAQGLISSYIRELFEDKKGSIWINTEGSLLKFNGKTLVNYSEKNELLKNTHNILKEDKEGNIWIANSKGLIKYNGKFFTVYDTTVGLPHHIVSGLEIGKDGKIWFGTCKGLTVFDGKQFVTYSHAQGLSANSVSCLMLDDKQRMWCGTPDSGAYCFDGETFLHLSRKTGMLSNEVCSMAFDKTGNIWITNQEGVHKFDGKSLELYKKEQGLPSNNVRNVMCDRKGNVWFSAYLAGMSCFDGNNFTWYTEREGLTIGTTDCFIEDNSGNIWVGTDGGGVCKLIRRSFLHFIPADFHPIIMSINEDDNGSIWLGSYDQGIYKFNGAKITSVNNKTNSLPTVTGMRHDDNGDIWFITAGRGLINYDGKTFKNYRTEQGLFSNAVTSITKDKDGCFWIGTNNEGVIKFEGKQFIRFGKEQGLNSNDVRDIEIDKEGNIWIATGMGLNKITGKKIYSFKEEQGLVSNRIRNIILDRHGNLWIASMNKGLNRYDGKFMMRITKDEGISNNFVRSVIEDHEGVIEKGYSGVWLSTDYGINHLLVKDDGRSINDLRIVTYTRDDGLRGEDFTSSSGFMDSKGRAWWGGVKGLTTLQTTDLPIDRDIPDVNLDHIELQQNYVDFNDLKDSVNAGKDWFIGEKNRLNLKNIRFTGVPAFKNYPENLELPFNINNITFNYSAINWLNGHKLHYQYLLEGSDKEWHPITAETKAIYTDLDHGTYTFKVRARGVLEVWSKPSEYTFIILPPWWQTIWAYSIYALVFIFSVVVYLKWRTRAFIKRQKELEHIIVERTADVVEEKNKVEEKSKIIEEKQKEIFDSLQYARQIQKLLLANHKLVNETLPDSFVVFKPKDIVSGDFYWAAKKEDRFYLAICDSTGHGVPGAFMSLLNINFLNEAINEKNIAEPNEVFNYVRKRLVNNLSQDGRQDGMDGILICVKDKSKKMTYAAANNAPVIIKNNVLSVLETDKMPIGKGEKNEPFKLYEFEMNKGDQLYLSTDGFADQFGGPKGKKYKYKPLYDLILKNNHLPVIEQEQALFEEFEKWKGQLEQVDDVCILGIRL